MRKSDIKPGGYYGVTCKKAGCQIVGEHIPMPDELRALPRPLSDADFARIKAHHDDPRQHLHRCLVIDNGRSGVGIEVPPGIVRLFMHACPECGDQHVGHTVTTEPKILTVRSIDIACPWEQAETWALARHMRRSDVSFGSTDAELDQIIGNQGG